MKFKLLSKRTVPFLGAVLFCFFSSDVVVAAEWSVEPSLSLREEYNDNIRFTTSPHPGVWQSRLTPSVKMSSTTEVSEVSGSAQMSINRYTGDPLVENRNDQFFTLFTRLRSELNAWAMNASYKQDSTSESETASTGVVHQTRTQRSMLSLSPSWTRTLTERSTVKLDYNYQDVKYDQHINLNDFTSQQAVGTLQYQLTENDQVSLATSYTKYDYAPTTVGPNLIGYISGQPVGLLTTTVNKYEVRNVQLAIDHEFSETLRGSAALGKRNNLSISEQSQAYCLTSACLPFGTPVNAKNETHGTGSSYSANLDKTFDAGKVSGFASRETNPSGNGLVETDKFGVSLNRRLTENLTGYFDAIAYRTRYIGLTYPGSRYYTVEPRLNWRFTEWWTLDAGYRYARYEPESVANATTANAITSNVVYLNLTYNWPKMAVSR